MKIAILAVWLLMWAVTWPALLANLQAIYSSDARAQQKFRSDLGAAMLFATFPPVWIATPFVTGFYEHGLQFNRKSPA